MWYVALEGKGDAFVLQVGMQVVYGIHGVCSIIDVETRNVDRKKVEYFVLEPNEQPGARFYVPTHNQVAVSKMRPLLTPAELDALLTSEDTHKDCWVVDENQRKQKYRELINSGDRAALISMIRSLLKHKEDQLAAGRKFHQADDNFLRDAERLLTSEISLVMELPAEEARNYLREHLQRA